MTALASEDDVRSALRRNLTESEAEWIDGLLEEASDLVAGYLDPYEIPETVPGPIVRVVASMVAAVLNRPSAILPDTQSLTADSYGVTFAQGATSPGPYLTDGFKRRLSPYKLGAGVVALSSERF
jgi:hypothetical protein